MSASANSRCLVFLVLLNTCVASGDLVNVTDSDSAVKPTRMPPLSAATAGNPVSPALDSVFLNLMSSFPEDLESSDYCTELLRLFGQRYVAYVNCLVLSARPVKVCQNCFSGYGSLKEIYAKISSDPAGSVNESCGDMLLRSDRLMLVYLLYSNLEALWIKSDCSNCVTEGSPSLTSDTLYFMAVLNRTLTCFQGYQQGNHTELCRNCRSPYEGLNELYSRMEKNHTMCIDIEDSMNITRRLWSKNFNCSVPRKETVPVIAVSSFMLFLPVIFYLSSFLHSEQKKRKLIHPNRAKSYNSLTSIQDKRS